MRADTQVSRPASGVPGDGEDDAAIITRSRVDPDCFAVLFHRHAAAITRYATRRLGPYAAEDVVAEVFLAAFGQRGRYEPAGPSARPWLFGIATNVISQHRRAEVRQYQLLARTGGNAVSESFTDRADERVSASAAGRKLAAALARLPAGYRDTLLLVVWAELSYDETAQALGVPVGTVRSRLSRARSGLRRALGNRDPSALAEEPGLLRWRHGTGQGEKS